MNNTTETWRGRAPLRPLLWGLALLCLLAGCRPRATSGPFDAEHADAWAAQLRAYLDKHPEDEKAWRDLAHVYWLHLGKTDEAVQILEKRDDLGSLLSRLLIADTRLEEEEARSLAYEIVKRAEAARPDPEAFETLASELAARTLSRLHGDQSGDDEAFVTFFDGLDLDALPYEVSQPLLSLRASIDRRGGEAYRSYYARQGCVQQFEAGPVTGNLGARELQLGLDPLPAFEPAPQARGEVVALPCVVRVWNPTMRSGIRRLRTYLGVPGDQLELDLGAEEPMRVWLDGTLIHRSDRIDRHPAGRARLRVPVKPGVHELQVAVAVPGENAWVLVRAIDEDGRPVPATLNGRAPQADALRGKPKAIVSPWPESAGPYEGELYEPLRLALGIEDALSVGDTDRAEILANRLDRFDAFAQGDYLQAQFERADPSRGTTVSVAREQSALEASLKKDPKLDAARLRLYEIMLGRGDDKDVVAALQALDEDRLTGVRGILLRFRALRSVGNEARAEALLEEAAQTHPDNCSITMTRRSLAQERADVKAEDELTEALAQCGGTLELRARLAQTRHRWDEAEALWSEALERVPDDIDVLESLARLAAIRGDEEAARARLQRVLELNPQRVGVHVGLADLAASRSDQESARRHIAKALETLPWSMAVREAAEHLDFPDELEDLRVDGLAAIEDYRASGAQESYDGAPEVLVLDRSAARVYGDGGLRTIVHTVVHLLSKEALDRYGELDVPEGARLLRLRSIKSDGRTFEPERIPGKDGLSLRNLEVGDMVEFEFVVEQPPSMVLPGYVDVTTFRFASQDVPYHRSELLVVHPTSMKIRIDRRGEPPATVEDSMMLGGEQVATKFWRADQVQRLGVEPGHRALLDELPSVRVYTELDVEQWLQNLAGNVRTAQRSNPALRRMVRRLTRGLQSDRERLEALWSWVVENVEDGGNLAVPATVTLASRTGNRLMLLRAMLEVAGIDNQVWLARDAFGPEKLKNGHPMIESYDAAMLAVRLDDEPEPTVVLTASKVMPIGYLTPAYAGTDGYALQLAPDEPAPRPVSLPESPPELADARRYELEIDVDRSGEGRVSGRIILQGMEAVAWRQALRSIDRDRVQEAFLQAELGWLRGARLQRLDIENEEALRKPLVLAFEATAPGFAIEQGGALVLRAAPLSFNPGARFTGLPRRTTGLVIPYAPRQSAELTYRLEGAKFVEVPDGTEIDSPFGHFRRTVEAGGSGKDTLTLRYDSDLKSGVVEAERYLELAGFTRKVEAAQEALIRAR